MKFSFRLNSLRFFGKFSVCLGIFWVIYFAVHARAFAADLALIWDGNQEVSIREVPGVRLFWWNIHDGQVNSDGSRADFQNNLSVLTHSAAAPDVLALGEYERSALGDDNNRELKTLYPFQRDFPYPGNENSGYGMGVYSKYPFQVSSVDAIGSRSLIILTLNIHGEDVIFVPVHIEDVWPEFKEQNGDLKTIEQVFIGTHNPVWDQIVKFHSALEARLGKRLTEKNFIMMGDFNSVKPGRAYEEIRGSLEDAIKGFTRTFPALTSDYRKTYPIQMQIDHAFVSQGTELQSAQVLPLFGSDHYPLYLIFSPGF